MSIELMRRIDYWAGIPLCFLLTVINFISRLLTFKRKEKSNIPKKILFIKLSEVGSIILAYPLMNKVRKECQDAKLFFLTFEGNKSIFEILDIIPYSNILTIREESFYLFILDILRTLRKIRKERMDIVFDLELFSRFTAILCYLSRGIKRIGFYRYSFEGLYRGNFFTHNIQYNPLIHISKSFLSLWQTIRFTNKSTPELEKQIGEDEIVLPRLTPSKEEREKIWRRLKEFGIIGESKLFVINAGEGRLPLREWPLENFMALSKMLLEDSQNYILFIGTAGASKKVEKICNVVKNKRCKDLTNKTTLPELLAIFEIANALITNDCGLAHLASLTLINKFIIFGPESPHIYSPLGENTYIIYSNLPCSPCLSSFNHRKSACIDNVCLKVIKPDKIFSLLNKYP